VGLRCAILASSSSEQREGRYGVQKLIDARPLFGGREELRVCLEAYRGVTRLHLRRWYRDGDVWKPGKGLAVTPDAIPWLRAKLAEAEAAALEAGLIPEEAYELLGEPLPAELVGEGV